MQKMSSPVRHVETMPENRKVRETLSVYTYLITLCVSCSALASGMTNSIIATTLGQPSFLTYFGFLDLTKTNTPLIGAINGVFFGAAIFGCAFASYLADRFGRKKALETAAVISIISAALVSGSVHIAMLIVFRGFAGFGSAMSMSVGAMLQTELAPPHYRGLVVGLVGAMISLGYMISNWIGVGFYFVDAGGAQWRIPFALCSLPFFAVLGLLPIIPESPRWLCMKGRSDEAHTVLLHLHGHGNEASENFAKVEMRQMARQIEAERAMSISWMTMFTARRYRKRMILTIVTMTLSQSAGVVTVSSYGPTIYATLGFSQVGRLSIQAGYTTWGLICAIIATLVVDRVGRVRMMTIGAILQITLLCIITALISKYAGTIHKSGQIATVAMFYIFQIGYCLFVEGPSYTYVSEIWPVGLRAQGTALGIASIYFIDTIYVEASLYAFETIGWKFYLVFIIVATFFTVVFLLLAKETKNVPLEEIPALFGDQIAVETLDELAGKFEQGPKAENDAEADVRGSRTPHELGEKVV